MKLYRYVTGPEGLAFSQRVSQALNDGWALYGHATLVFDPVRQKVVCGQTLVKETDRPDDYDVQRLLGGD